MHRICRTEPGRTLKRDALMLREPQHERESPCETRCSARPEALEGWVEHLFQQPARRSMLTESGRSSSLLPMRRLRAVTPLRGRLRSFGLLAVLILSSVSAASAHSPPRQGTRELVRVQGYRGPAPTGTTVAREVVLVANGVEHRFFATEWRVFRLEEMVPGAQPPLEPSRMTLQADFDILARFTAARPEQTVTILAERRPGSADLFLLALDVCPRN